MQSDVKKCPAACSCRSVGDSGAVRHIQFFARLNTAKASERAIKSLRDELFGHIQKLPFSRHTAHQTGDIIQRCTSDVEVVRNFVSAQMVEVFRIVFLIVMTMCIMFSMNVKISLVAVVLSQSSFFTPSIFRGRSPTALWVPTSPKENCLRRYRKT